MKDLLPEIRDYLKRRGVDYADLRFESAIRESVVVRNGSVERVSSSQDQGVGIRVLLGGGWGFAATSETSRQALRQTANLAMDIARASALVSRRKVVLSPEPAQKGTYRSPCKKDPFKVPLSAKIDLLAQACDVLQKDDRIRVARGNIRWSRTRKWFFNTEGTETEQDITVSAAGIAATAVSDNDAQKRSFPAGHDGDAATLGFEFIEQMDIAGNAERVREEAVALLTAPECPSGDWDIILDGSQMALQIHESCGHPIELDRVMGTELSLAGGSFLTLDRQGHFRYGSPIVHITADATIPGGRGSFGYDDEGVPAQRYDIVKDGIFVGYLSSRETAPVIGVSSGGAMRAEGWNSIPLIRMTNINLEPGKGSLEDLIADTKKGLLMDANRVWSIDDRRMNFQFGCEIAWEIENGKLGRVFKNPAYRGITPEFWGCCDAICGPENWHVWGVSNCGKGEPMQTIGTGHGAAPTRFRSVRVGAEK